MKLLFTAVYKPWMEQYSPVFTVIKENVKKKIERFLKRMTGMTENLLYGESEENALLHSEKSLRFGIQIQDNPMARSQSVLFRWNSKRWSSKGNNLSTAETDFST